ncbi:helix-turn-helix domain-containing protein [Gulosibacter molinativorax]|uniref:Helix-turn-helix domain-containing protein n=1 Tax=Gulosibacter molinativorax TaxID=256821 RepID=A0ABT7CA43_9MICO|nr:helix-turn-helix domain-containing protein [Gulosibacter molinativorax]MDJ1372067.1 helix-turn-helix domain-containing protein [Gulosibacter molinativorax]QUY63884.1 Hypothetical protein GMOLON4_3213 [Gulosibacter molinativorax]
MTAHSKTPAPIPASLLTIEQAADFLQVSTKTIRRWIATGDLPARRFGGRAIRIRRADIEAMGEPLTARSA